jgi:hypothetical protein
MPWYWTDDLARTLIDTGKVDAARVAAWIVAPVAIRREAESVADVAGALLEEDADGSQPWAARAA